MHSAVNILIALLIGITGGGLTAWYSVQSNHRIGAINIGQWTAWPLMGNVDADPYTEAKVAIDGELPLGGAEGLAFHADRDNEGQRLRRDCGYLISGSTPAARLWTLSIYDPSGRPVPPVEGARSAAFSRSLLRNADGSFSIKAGSSAHTGNWLSITGRGDFSLVLRLYDTPITSSAGLVDPVMPRITKIGCPA